MSKITIEVWSDVMCPFCYIGKRQLERALREFPQGEAVEVIWKSFQLQPDLQTEPSKSVLQSLSESKGWSREQTLSAMAHVTEIAAAEGLHYDFERAVVANSFDAHRLTHLAKAHGLQNAVEEGLFAAYFCEGKNTADAEVLRSIGLSAGLPPDAVDALLTGDAYAEEMHHDIYEARQVGVSGVPFFVFNDRLAVSGARGSEVFLQVLGEVAKN